MSQAPVVGPEKVPRSQVGGQQLNHISTVSPVRKAPWGLNQVKLQLIISKIETTMFLRCYSANVHKSFWAPTRPVLIVSPHLDDAALSCAWLLGRDGVEVLTVFSGHPSTPITTSWDVTCGFSDSSEAMTRRRQEDASALDQTGIRAHHLPLLDSAYLEGRRGAEDGEVLATWVQNWIRMAPNGIRPVIVVPAGAGHRFGHLAHTPKAGAVSSNGSDGFPEPGLPTTEHFSQRARRFAEGTVLGKVGRWAAHRLFILRARRATGFLAHSDHLFVRNTLLQSLVAADAADIVLFEDLPYLWSRSADTAVSDLSASMNIDAQEIRCPVETVDKFARIRHYASQIPNLDPGRRLESPQTLPSEERYWILAGQLN